MHAFVQLFISFVKLGFSLVEILGAVKFLGFIQLFDFITERRLGQTASDEQQNDCSREFKHFKHAVVVVHRAVVKY